MHSSTFVIGVLLANCVSDCLCVNSAFANSRHWRTADGNRIVTSVVAQLKAVAERLWRKVGPVVAKVSGYVVEVVGWLVLKTGDGKLVWPWPCVADCVCVIED